MEKKLTVKGPNTYRYIKLQNRIVNATSPVSVDHTFLTDVLDLEKSYDVGATFMYRKNSHPIRQFHVTEMTLRLLMTISRRFNAQGTLAGVSVHRLFQMMNEEYEDAASKEQFYAEVRKFEAVGLLSVNQSGIISEWRVESFKRSSGRFVLFNPCVFSKAFTDLPAAAQKLYLYIVSRNGEKVNTEFKEFLTEGSWIYTLTHKSRPAQVRELIESLAALEPVKGERLFTMASVEKDDIGRWSLRCTLNPAYLVRHNAGEAYRMVPAAKIPYSRTASRLRMLLSFFKIGEIESIDNGRFFARLTAMLQNAGMKTLRFVVKRLREMYERSGILMGDPIHALEVELKDPSFVQYMEIAKDTGLYRYLGMGGEDVFDEARPMQFFRSIKDVFSTKSFKTACQKAIPLLKERFGDQLDKDILFTYRPPRHGMAFEYDTFYVEDFLLEHFGPRKA
ncbi:hypothetical protein J2T17_004422 [Paenibacillus mucilaginosus]|uniref:hypothetical protein n=1 Tax=Paenibacillus mucilaginosus TaxID=61624 RepID=UPI003D1D4013